MRRNRVKDIMLDYAQSLEELSSYQSEMLKELQDSFKRQREIYEELGKIGKVIGALADESERRYNQDIN